LNANHSLENMPTFSTGKMPWWVIVQESCDEKFFGAGTIMPVEGISVALHEKLSFVQNLSQLEMLLAFSIHYVD
jgi:hypothetical protein